MKNNKGAITIFALIAMMFFLIFIMVAYNNLAQKGKTQVETTGVLLDEYISDMDSTAIYKKMDAGTLPTDTTQRSLLVKTDEQSSTITNTVNSGKYIALDGKFYKIP